MILGNAISAIGVGINTISRELSENKDKVETYLAMGASRFEAVKPAAVEALKLALLPTVNQMSVIGLISIPGMSFHMLLSPCKRGVADGHAPATCLYAAQPRRQETTQWRPPAGR